MIDGAGGGETLPRHPASKARHLLLGEKAWGAALVERRRNGIAIVRDVRQHGIRQARLATSPRGEGIARCNHFARKRGAGTSSTQRKNVHGRVASMHVSGQMGFPAGRVGAYAAGGHAPNRVPRRVSCAGRVPGSGCAAARGRGP